MSSKFIVIYGANNLGKTTQVKLLAKKLKKQKKKVKILKYPIYNLEPTGPMLNKFLRKGLDLTDYEAQYLYARNRKDYEPKLKEILKKGYWIIAEDYKGTGMSWGITKGIPLKKMLSLNESLLDEDIAILLDGKRFHESIEKGHHFEDSDFWEKGRKAHLKIGKLFGWKKIDANQTREKIAEDIWKIISSS